MNERRNEIFFDFPIDFFATKIKVITILLKITYFVYLLFFLYITILENNNDFVFLMCYIIIIKYTFFSSNLHVYLYTLFIFKKITPYNFIFYLIR